MDNSKKLTLEEKAEGWAHLCRHIGSRLNWSDAFVSGYRTAINETAQEVAEKDALLKEAKKLFLQVVRDINFCFDGTTTPPQVADKLADCKHRVSEFIKTTGSEARNDAS